MDFIKKTTPEFVQAEQDSQARPASREGLHAQIQNTLGKRAKASSKRHSRKKRDQKTKNDRRDQ